MELNKKAEEKRNDPKNQTKIQKVKRFSWEVYHGTKMFFTPFNMLIMAAFIGAEHLISHGYDSIADKFSV